MGGHILGEDLLQLGIHLIAVGLGSLNGHLNAAVGHEGTLQGLVGLDADDLAVQNAALGALFLLQLLQSAPQLVGGLRGVSQEGLVTVIGLIVLLNEVTDIDFVFPDTAFKAVPLFEIAHNFNLHLLTNMVTYVSYH